MSILGERFFKLSNALFCYHLTPIQFTVYSFLVSSAGQKEVCWPSMKTIAANCGCSVNAAREAIRVLEQMGVIRCVKRYRDLPNGGVRQTSNAFFIFDAPPPSVFENPNHSKSVQLTSCQRIFYKSIAKLSRVL